MIKKTRSFIKNWLYVRSKQQTISNISTNKKALLCYITQPFKNKLRISHCNQIECQKIEKVLNKIGYSLDVIDYRSKKNINFQQYSLAIGFGDSFSNFIANKRNDAKAICYLTGANPNYSNIAEAERIRALYIRKQKRLRTRRQVAWNWSYAALNADFIIATGNDWTASTYKDLPVTLRTVPVPTIAKPISENELPDHPNRLGFLWFGGSGAVHKGLDLVIDACCSEENDFTLDICGPIGSEGDFVNAYKKELFHHPRIKFHGSIDANGNKMKEIVSRNAFAILPSCSEGAASSVITCMAYGLIPVVARQAGIDLKKFGYLISDLTPEATISAMRAAAASSLDDVKRQQKNVLSFVNKYHTPEVFERRLEALLDEILKNA